MADTTASLQQRLQVLLDAIYDESERQLTQQGDETSLDRLDYGSMAALIESHTPSPAEDGRTAFMNALAEGLCDLAYERCVEAARRTELTVKPGQTTVKKKGGRGTYYNPPTVIKDVAGVTKKQCMSTDFYSGTLEALVATGLATVDMFPGQPGRGGGDASYRPIGADRVDGSWFKVPGYMSIHRYPDNKFQVRLTVSRDEQERRQAAESARAREERAVWQLQREQEANAARRPVQPPAAPPNLRPQRLRPGHLRVAWSAPTT